MKRRSQRQRINKKNITLIIIAIVILLLGIIFLIRGYNKETETINGLKISYSKSNLLSFNNFNNKFKEKMVITIENISNENKTYSLEWIDIVNKLKKQNVFLYEIECSGDRCATLGKSQVPIVGITVFPQCLIESGKKQKYTIIFTYSGSEKNANFKGKLNVSNIN